MGIRNGLGIQRFRTRSNGSLASRNEMDHEKDQCHDQKDMHESAGDVEHYECAEPYEKEDQGKSEECVAHDASGLSDVQRFDAGRAVSGSIFRASSAL
jgi:hypothetical protein